MFPVSNGLVSPQKEDKPEPTSELKLSSLSLGSPRTSAGSPRRSVMSNQKNEKGILRLVVEKAQIKADVKKYVTTPSI